MRIDEISRENEGANKIALSNITLHHCDFTD